MDHSLVLGCLNGATHAANLRYLGKHTRFPIRPTATLDKADCMFADLWRAIPRPPRRESHRQSWISPKTWSMIDKRIEAHRRRYKRSSRDLAHAIKAALQGDWRRWDAKEDSAVESLIKSNLPLISKPFDPDAGMV